MSLDFRTKWIKSISGKWYSFEVPISLKLESTIVSILKDSDKSDTILPQIISELLHIPIEEIEQELTHFQLSSMLEIVLLQINESLNDSSDQLTNTDNNEVELDQKDTISSMIAFLSYYGKIQPSEVLKLPRTIVVKIIQEISELLKTDKTTEYDLSIINALNMMFGDKKKSNTNTNTNINNTNDNDTIDLSKIDLDSFNELNKVESLTGVIKVE